MNAFVLLIFYAVKFPPVQLVEMFRIHRLRKKKSHCRPHSPTACVSSVCSCDCNVRPNVVETYRREASPCRELTCRGLARRVSTAAARRNSLRRARGGCLASALTVSVPTLCYTSGSPDYAAFCNSFPLFCSCSTDEHRTWYHALPHFKENMLNWEEKMWFGLAAVLIYRIWKR